MRHWLPLLTVSILAAGESAAPVPWPAVDGLGRQLAMPGDDGVPAHRPDRHVTMFYFIWHPSRPAAREPAQQTKGADSIEALLTQHPDALTNNARWPDGTTLDDVATAVKAGKKLFAGGLDTRVYHWGEPLFGYYRVTDPWVIDRHMRMLSDAGVDGLIIDITNHSAYTSTCTALFDHMERMRQGGVRVPGFAFISNTTKPKANPFQQVWDHVYEPQRWRELWYAWKGRPLACPGWEPVLDQKHVAADERLDLTEAQRALFTLRYNRHGWRYFPSAKHGIHWVQPYPQQYGWDSDPKRAEIVNVTPAQNLSRNRGAGFVPMSSGQARGRSYHDGKTTAPHLPPYPPSTASGANFREQWSRVTELDPEMVFITSWNEWTAGRFVTPKGQSAFHDQFTSEYSRDLEPARGQLADHYYYQTIDHIRRYKGVPPLPKLGPATAIDINGPMTQWNAVTPVFADHRGDTLHRDHLGYGDLRYTDSSGRNDLTDAKLAWDGQQVAFHIQTAADLTPVDGGNWMWLFIDADQNPQTGWCGFDYLVNRSAPSGGQAVVEKHVKDFTWERAGTAAIRWEGRQLHLGISRAVLGLAGTAAPRLDFKWADHLTQPGDALDFHISGDTAPDGRFRFRAAIP